MGLIGSYHIVFSSKIHTKDNRAEHEVQTFQELISQQNARKPRGRKLFPWGFNDHFSGQDKFAPALFGKRTHKGRRVPCA
jgi:hypothetical protein